jgi:hypothetical protein
MSDFILEILEPVANTIDIETSILDTDNITIQYQNNNTIDIETSILDTVTDNITIEYQNNNTIDIETSILDIDNITIEYQNNNTIEIVNTEKILASNLPYGYPIENTIGDLPYTRVSGLTDYVDQSSTTSMQNHILQYHITLVGPALIDGGSP